MGGKAVFNGPAADLQLTTGEDDKARAVLLHELGHLVGLGHVTDPYQVMYDTNSYPLPRYHAGDRAGSSSSGRAAASTAPDSRGRGRAGWCRGRRAAPGGRERTGPGRLLPGRGAARTRRPRSRRRRLPDGTVEVVVEGPSAGVSALIDWLHRGTPQSQVADVVITDEVPEGLTGFRVG